jgi:hypothetical protein
VDSAPAGSAPSIVRVSCAAVLSIVVSLGADAGLVKWVTNAVPATADYSHFRFVDYGTLTVVGVSGACAAWYVVTRVTSSPRWLFLRLAVAVMLVLWIPDMYLFARGEPANAVLILMLMHLAIALVTYNSLVHLAPVSDPTSVAVHSPSSARLGINTPPEHATTFAVSRGAWTTMMLLVGAEMLIGFVELLSVPFDRPNGWVVRQGEAVTLVHGALGGVLGFGALTIFALASRQGRIEHIAAVVGLIGVAVGGLGGFFCYAHSLRLFGMVLMFFGAATAFFGYLMPTIDDPPSAAPLQPPNNHQSAPPPTEL